MRKSGLCAHYTEWTKIFLIFPRNLIFASLLSVLRILCLFLSLLRAFHIIIYYLHVQSKIQCLSIMAFNTVLNGWIWVSIPCVICIQFWHNFFTTNQLFYSIHSIPVNFIWNSIDTLEVEWVNKWTRVRNIRSNSFIIAAAPHLHVNQCSEQQIQFTYSKQSLQHAYFFGRWLFSCHIYRESINPCLDLGTLFLYRRIFFSDLFKLLKEKEMSSSFKRT